MDKKKKKLMWTILIVGLIQMPVLALTPGINLIATTAFADRSLSAVQQALAVSALSQPVAAFLAAMIINRRIVSKKAVIMFGLLLLSSTSVLAILFHSKFWHIVMLSTFLGISTGCFISNMFALIFDFFDPGEKQVIMGTQSSFINIGGIMMSLLGGLLATFFWYGGYLMLFVGIPGAVLVYFAVPKYKVPEADPQKGKSRARLNPKIYYYLVIEMLFMMAYSACSSNISTHIAGLGNSATAGIAVACTMSGGVVSGLIFGKLSEKTGDYSLTCGFGCMFAGFMMLSIFTGSLMLTFAAVFIVGLALSIILPRCILMVSNHATDPATSATATALATIVAPSAGSFISPLIITNITTAIYGASTAARYRFVGFFVLALAASIAVVTTVEKKKNNTYKEANI